MPPLSNFLYGDLRVREYTPINDFVSTFPAVLAHVARLRAAGNVETKPLISLKNMLIEER